MPDSYRVLRQTTNIAYNERNDPIESIRVEVKVGDDGPFFLTFLKDGFNAFDAQQKLEAFAQQVKKLKGE